MSIPLWEADRRDGRKTDKRSWSYTWKASSVEQCSWQDGMFGQKLSAIFITRFHTRFCHQLQVKGYWFCLVIVSFTLCAITMRKLLMVGRHEHTDALAWKAYNIRSGHDPPLIMWIHHRASEVCCFSHVLFWSYSPSNVKFKHSYGTHQ